MDKEGLQCILCLVQDRVEEVRVHAVGEFQGPIRTGRLFAAVQTGRNQHPHARRPSLGARNVLRDERSRRTVQSGQLDQFERFGGAEAQVVGTELPHALGEQTANGKCVAASRSQYPLDLIPGAIHQVL